MPARGRSGSIGTSRSADREPGCTVRPNRAICPGPRPSEGQPMSARLLAPPGGGARRVRRAGGRSRLPSSASAAPAALPRSRRRRRSTGSRASWPTKDGLLTISFATVGRHDRRSPTRASPSTRSSRSPPAAGATSLAVDDSPTSTSRTNLAPYITGATSETPTSAPPTPIAKTLLMAEIPGDDASDFGGSTSRPTCAACLETAGDRPGPLLRHRLDRASATSATASARRSPSWRSAARRRRAGRRRRLPARPAVPRRQLPSATTPTPGGVHRTTPSATVDATGFALMALSRSPRRPP